MTNPRWRLVAIAALELLIAVNVLYALPFGSRVLYDFAAFRASAQAVLVGHNPYAEIHPWRMDGVSGFDVNLDPPVVSVLYLTVATLPESAGARLWDAANLLLYVGMVLLLTLWGTRRLSAIRLLWVLALGGFWSALALGQVYVVVAALLVVAWLLAREGKLTTAAIAVGVAAAIKPPLVLILALLFFSRCRKYALVGASAGVVISVVPLVLFGPGVYLNWVAADLAYGPAHVGLPVNGALAAPVARVFGSTAGTFVGIAFGAILVAWGSRTSGAPYRLLELGIAGALLASPITWIGYDILALPIFFARPWSKLTTVSAVLLLVPPLVLWRLVDLGQVGETIAGVLTFVPLALLLFSVASSLPTPAARPTGNSDGMTVDAVRMSNSP